MRKLQDMEIDISGMTSILATLDLKWIIGIIFSIISIIIAIYISPRYYIRGKNKGNERYTVLEKLEFSVKSGGVDCARIVLKKSNFKNAMGFMDITIEDNDHVSVNCYAFIHSCIHNIFSPGKIILKPEDCWKESAPSNEFDYLIISTKRYKNEFSLPIEIPKNIKNRITDYVAIESTFEYDKKYSGPRYQKRRIILAKGIGIIYSKTEYKNKSDCYILKKYKIFNGNDSWFPVSKTGNWWEYEIIYEHGPNSLNISE